jgi:hypothetical protein
LQPEGLPADGERIGRKPAVEEAMLLILDDDQPTSPGVVEDAAVVGDQRGIGLIRPRSDDDCVVRSQVPTLQLSGA